MGSILVDISLTTGSLLFTGVTSSIADDEMLLLFKLPLSSGSSSLSLNNGDLSGDTLGIVL